LDEKQHFNPVIFQAAERASRKASVTYRQLNMKKFEQEVATVFEIYNDAWEDNWGFVPMTVAELQHLAKELKPIVDPRLVLFAEVNGEPAGFSVSLPDINFAIAKVPSGKLLPTGLLKLLWYLKGPGRKGIKMCRVVTLGVRKKFQPLGLGPLLYAHIIKEFPKYGYAQGEASWILEETFQ
jgi:GNAT superfamily N-acetyltransferase